VRIRAISLDLDDTLWPIEPVIVRAEQHLEGWLQQECPHVAAAWPVAELRALRERIYGENPHLGHDFTALRKMSLRAVFTPFDMGEDWVERAYIEYFTARNQVECYTDAVPALERLAALLPLVSISNGNADLDRIGLRRFFQFSVSAREFGTAKPHASIFHTACERLGLQPHEVLHVGDDAVLDVLGARDAGLRTAWLNRGDTAWAHAVAPDLTLSDLGQLAHWLENHQRGI
jgi:2-haloalkanoic acid dehalogenase type II